MDSADHHHGPKSKSSNFSDDEDLSDYEPLKFRLELAPFGLERLSDYEDGLFHPVHIDDILNERYRVVHKLGSGGFATVWLCHDSEDPGMYKALKIMISEAPGEECGEMRGVQLKSTLDAGQRNQSTCAAPGTATSLCLPLDQFDVRGPNGLHHCFVYPVLGPKSSLGRFTSLAEDKDKTLRTICYQLTETVASLHAHGVCHGDVTASNVLQRVVGLDTMSESEVIEILGTPRLNPVLPIDESTEATPGVPRYLVYPVDWTAVDEKYISADPFLIDLGESFEVSSPPEKLGTPREYLAPELMLDGKPSVASDLWALACTLFTIRTGRKLFDSFDDDDDGYLDAVVQLLGVLPEPWWSTTWGCRKTFYEPDAEGRVVLIHAVEPQPPNPNVRVHPSVADGSRSLRDKLAPGVWYIDSGMGPGQDHRDIDEAEIDCFADLLGKLLRYVPEERISAREALSHAWFSM